MCNLTATDNHGCHQSKVAEAKISSELIGRVAMATRDLPFISSINKEASIIAPTTEIAMDWQ